MKKLTDNEFADFYYKKIYPFIKTFEDKRLVLVQKIQWTISIFVMIFLAVIMFVFLPAGNTCESIGDLIGGCVAIFAGHATLAGFIVNYFISQYQSNLKSSLYNQIFQQFELNYSNSKQDKIEATSVLYSICAKSQMFYRYDKIDIDDTIKGNYNTLPINIYDAKISYTTGTGKNRRTIIPFQGIFIATKIIKKLTCETLIKSEQNLSSFIGGGGNVNISFGNGGISVTKNTSSSFVNSNKQNVKLEDVEFEKAFEVYSSDQIEGRYLLTPAFMNRLLEYRNKKKYNIEIFFSNQMGMEENVFLFIHNNKDNFELPIFKKIDKDGFYSVIKEIYDALEIIDALKFEQNIGM